MQNCFKIIDLKALKNNLQYIKSKLNNNTKLCAVVKDNAYGHGIKNVLPILKEYANYYAVANIDEAIELRKLTTSPILILGECPTESLDLITKNNIEVTVSSMHTLLNIIKLHPQNINIHLAIDSGMHRLGFDNLKEFKQAIKLFNKYKCLNLKGVFSHIGDAQNNKRLAHQKQSFIRYYAQVLKKFSPIIHIANSDTMHIDKTMQFNMVRVGINLYGYGNDYLTPVMSVVAKIVHTTTLNNDDYVGYGSQHYVKKGTKLATINIGYGQGYMRSNEKFSYVIINGKLCKVIANVCMDMIIVDISNTKCRVGDYAIIMGKQGVHSIDANLLATLNKTIPYEILTNFNLIKNSVVKN